MISKARKNKRPVAKNAKSEPCRNEMPKNLKEAKWGHFFLRTKKPARPKMPDNAVKRLKKTKRTKDASALSGEKMPMTIKKATKAIAVEETMPER